MKSVLKTSLAAALAAALLAACGHGNDASAGRQVKVARGKISEVVQAAGEVNPMNKVSIIPPVTGRIDQIVEDEGATVKRGQVLAWMSSSDRAAILDNARSEGPEVYKKWENEYKSTPIVAPTDGLIIARNVVTGQTVDADTDMYDLSDRLVVFASVDETDLAKIHMGQLALCTVEAYPDKVFPTHVTLIGHQAIRVNNVISYQINLDPVKVPGELRAGMTANVNFVVQEKKDVLWIPSYAVKGLSDGPAKVQVLPPGGGQPESRSVVLGITDGVKVEVVSGLALGDTVLIPSLNLPKAMSGGPMSAGGGGHGGGGGGGH
ncbi:MAG TPA: efflux RND transporter periplasmic adaptor subunit [bacterium]|jgi:macrolide-specific efflux system membrane fusion protein|nr:efflux RND transporter periplasmic adaptor subunit [bacterium]